MIITDSFRAPRVVTIATSVGTLHAADAVAAQTSTPGGLRTVCGRELAPRTWLMMRSAPTADAYVTCKACARRLADGVTVSDATVRRARLAAQLADPHNH